MAELRNDTTAKTLNMSLGEHIIDVIWREHVKFHEFRMHRSGDMNLSSFSFSEFCTLEKQE
jgi:hypothetical protein